MKTTALFRPIGPDQFEALKKLEFSQIPSHVFGQKFFYPQLHESFAKQIAKEWYLPKHGHAYVIRLEIACSYLEQFEVKRIGGPEHTEYRIPIEEKANFSRELVGKIEVIAEYQQDTIKQPFLFCRIGETTEAILSPAAGFQSHFQCLA
ncbi:hypothetical protein H0A36_23735 [Endozoicomonas sp. SM1973]|uniref:ADP-ribosylation/crystallin J1 n=1 Tax=Spartinivicinus marinus TaxID=2994442 RepID=A0A853IML5_9GAMM|nr:hypothetical protein [Spartinivicinus marinus]MCX4027823.1 hypothetical protein [Spartinivicinus marinus]NYZ69036.1 hypothetical protein [Spartinivicinus marinus]